MTYYEKLVLILGRKPVEGSLEYNKKIMKLKSIEESARDLFNGEIKLVPGQKEKAKKLGLL
ncbi:MAG: hypothetical protein WCP65_00775 [Bacteroidota bacterium]|jgi:hypothetical protein